jgi:Putative zinc-finger
MTPPMDPMAHPDDLLADYVDGTLPDRERAVVDAHLGSCARCREETDLARSASTALRALEEVPVPLGVTGRVLDEARSGATKPAARTDTSRWIAGLAAAAVVLGVVAVAVSRPGDDPTLNTAQGGTGAAGGSRAPATLEDSGIRLEEQRDVNYDGDEGVLVLAREVIDEYRRASAQAPATDGTDEGDAEAAAPSATSEALATGAEFADARKVDPGPAIRCLEEAGLPPAGADMRLRRLVEATYNGDPAYLAVFLQGPGAGQPPDRAVVFVLSRRDCSIVNFLNLGFDAPEASG